MWRSASLDLLNRERHNGSLKGGGEFELALHALRVSHDALLDGILEEGLHIHLWDTGQRLPRSKHDLDVVLLKETDEFSILLHVGDRISVNDEDRLFVIDF